MTRLRLSLTTLLLLLNAACVPERQNKHDREPADDFLVLSGAYKATATMLLTDSDGANTSEEIELCLLTDVVGDGPATTYGGIIGNARENYVDFEDNEACEYYFGVPLCISQEGTVDLLGGTLSFHGEWALPEGTYVYDKHYIIEHTENVEDCNE